MRVIVAMQIIVEMTLVKVDVQAWQRSKQIAKPLFGRLSAVKVERFQLGHAVQVFQAGIRDWRVNQMQETQVLHVRDVL